MVPGYLYKNEETGAYEYDWNSDFNQRNVLRETVKVCEKLFP